MTYEISELNVVTNVGVEAHDALSRCGGRASYNDIATCMPDRHLNGITMGINQIIRAGYARWDGDYLVAIK
jgi:hypothetical protein